MKKILVTGASTGIGNAITLSLANAGHTVYAGVRNKVDYEKLQEIPNVIPIYLDVTKSDDISTAVSTITSKGTLDVLINNAGVTIPGATIEISLEQIRKLLEVNLLGVISITQSCFNLLRNSKGLIINISSIHGHAPIIPWSSPYDMSKFALETFSETLRKELKKFDIKICVVNPGGYKTKMFYKGDNELKNLTSQSTYFKEEFQKFYENYDPDKIGGDPAIVGREVLEIVESENPPEAYISGTEGAKEWVYQTMIHRLVQLVQSSTKDQDPRNLLVNYIEKELQK